MRGPPRLVLGEREHVYGDPPIAPLDACAGGWYQVGSSGILFLDRAAEPAVCIVCSPRGETWPVSCWRDSRGRVHYMHELADVHIERFGLPTAFDAQVEWAAKTLKCWDAWQLEQMLGQRPVVPGPPVSSVQR